VKGISILKDKAKNITDREEFKQIKKTTIDIAKKSAIITKKYAVDISNKAKIKIDNISNNFKESFNLENDEIYWQKKATIGEYFYQIENGIIVPDRLSNDEDDLYYLARKAVGNIAFNDFFKDEKDYFSDLTPTDMAVSVAIGVVGATYSYILDKEGKNIEDKIDNHKISDGYKDENGKTHKIKIKEFDKNNPFDYAAGNNHRLTGHDIFSFTQKIPSDYKFRGKVPVGELVGSNNDTVTFSELFNTIYSNPELNKCQNIINSIKHIVVHFAKDIFTPSGLPLPFTELFTKFEANPKFKKDILTNTAQKYTLTNDMSKKLGNCANSIRASDVTSPIVIKMLLEIYYQGEKLITKKNLEKDAKKLRKAQLAIMSYGTCLIVQLLMYLMKYNEISKHVVDGARVNYIMISTLVKNLIQIDVILNKANKQILLDYEKMIENEINLLEENINNV